ncbi:GNAT family N-acetyltransferase [Streptomyces sp. NPDC094143]|uniref:GNAT family N-acetyltransferase n=1 Tax=Streptomyces sp. NPDC094143 TaxID=3155310 RepID=UPI0033237D24
MTTLNLAPGITLEDFDPRRTQDVESVQRMFTDYLLEEFDRIGELAFGSPVGDYLATRFIRCQGQDAGFMSVDTGRYAVEIIYVAPAHRGQGLARMALEELDRICPQKLALKTPLSPGGEALATLLNLDRADNFPHEEAKNEEHLRIMLAGVKQTCPHGKRSGDPRKPCARCYRKYLRRYAAIGMKQHTARYRP